MEGEERGEGKEETRGGLPFQLIRKYHTIMTLFLDLHYFHERYRPPFSFSPLSPLLLLPPMAAPSASLPSLSPLDDLHSFWSQKWEAPKLGWHLEGVNPNLEKYNEIWLGDTDKNSAFVPLCGKSEDLAYLASHSKVSHVVGIDIVRDAAEQFASEHPELSMVELAGDGTTTCAQDGAEQSCKAPSDGESALATASFFRGKNISFLLGDLFDFMGMTNDERSNCINRGLPEAEQKKSQFDAIYDRASMIAIEPSKRQDYVALLGSILRPGGSILLVTIEKRTCIKEESKLSGPPFSIEEKTVRQFYERQDWVESVTLLEERNEIVTDADKERWEARGVSEAYELVFLIRKKK